MKGLSLALVLGTILSNSSWAQPIRSLPADKMLQIGDENFNKADTYTALEWYTKASEADPSNVYALHQIAQTHEKLRDYKQASEAYGKLVKADKKNEYPFALYKHAYTLKLNGQYQESIAQFLEFQKVYAGENAEKYKKMAELEIEGARWARKNPDQPEPLVIENVGRGINTPSSEDGAFAAGRDRIYFSSLRADTLIYPQEAPEDKKIAKIYTSARTSDGKGWEDSKEFNDKVLFKAGTHATQPSFTPDKSYFYFSRAELKGNMLSNSRIFVCKNQDGTISEPVSLPFNAATYSCKNPKVGVIDGKNYLFFASDKDGGKGGFDVWYAEINPDGTTKEPLNVGDPINTEADDITPFFDARENMFYYSTQGYPTVGGFDVFKSKYENGKFSKPENMGFGFNSRVDDFGFMINQEGKDDCYGYVVSNRPGTISMKSETCCDDIFSIIMPNRCDIDATITVIDEQTKKPLDGGTVQLIDKATGQVVAEKTNTAGNTFEFTVAPNKEYEVVAKKDGYDKPASVTKLSTSTKEIGEVTKPVSIKKETSLKELGLMVETYNAKSQAPLTGVEIAVIDAKTGTELKKETHNDKNRYVFAMGRDREYKIVAKREGFKDEVRTMTLEQVKKGEMQKLYLTPFELPIFYDVFFDFNKSELRKGAVDTLEMVYATLKQYENLVVEVRGHTDALGQDAYNDRLSERRSKTAVDWLFDKGIARERMIPRALGEKEPVAENEKDGTDNPEGRQKNRRVEFKIIDAKDIQSGTPAPKVEPTPAPKPKTTKVEPKKTEPAKAEPATKVEPKKAEPEKKKSVKPLN